MKSVPGITFFLCLVFAGKAFACTCPSGDSIDPKTAIKLADVIFSGTVVWGEMVQNPSPSQDASPYIGTRFRFEVIRAFKGKVGKEVQLESGLGRGDCGRSFEIGRDYLVYAHGATKKLSTSGCNRTLPLFRAQEDLDELKKLPRKP